MDDVVRMLDRSQPVQDRGQCRWKRGARRDAHPRKRFGDARRSEIARLRPYVLPEGLDAVLPVLLTLISGPFERLRERLC